MATMYWILDCGGSPFFVGPRQMIAVLGGAVARFSVAVRESVLHGFGGCEMTYQVRSLTCVLRGASQ